MIETLPVDAVLGSDLPIILDLILEAEKTEGIYSEERGKASVKFACTIITQLAQEKDSVQPVPNLDISLCEGDIKGQETPGARATLKSSSRYQVMNRKMSYLPTCGKYLKMFQSCR